MALLPGVDRSVDEFDARWQYLMRGVQSYFGSPATKAERIAIGGAVETMEWANGQVALSPVRRLQVAGTTHDFLLEFLAAGEARKSGNPWADGAYLSLTWLANPDGDRWKAHLDSLAQRRG